MDLKGGSVIRLIWSPVVLPALFGNWLQNHKRMAQKNGDKMINNERTCSLFQPETCTCCSSVVYEKSVRRCAAVTSEISWLLNVKKLLSFIMKLPLMLRKNTTNTRHPQTTSTRHIFCSKMLKMSLFRTFEPFGFFWKKVTILKVTILALEISFVIFTCFSRGGMLWEVVSIQNTSVAPVILKYIRMHVTTPHNK